MMKKIIIAIIFLGFITACSNNNNSVTENLGEVSFLNSTITFETLSNSQTLLETSDFYTQRLSVFDIKAKTQNTASTTEADYLEFAKNQALEWTSDEIAATKLIIEEAEQKIKDLGLNMTLPSTIKLIKSTVKEEGGEAGGEGYTRTNYIVLKSTPPLGLFLHEIFHVYSRENETKRDQLYSTINFTKCNEISYPDAIKDRKITNPDAPLIEHYITLNINGENKQVAFVTVAGEDYTTGVFFQYLQQQLMHLEGDSNTNKSPILVNNEPILNMFSDATDIIDKIGNNTDYNLHPEEILAEHFKFLVEGTTVSQPQYLEAIKTILQE